MRRKLENLASLAEAKVYIAALRRKNLSKNTQIWTLRQQTDAMKADLLRLTKELVDADEKIAALARQLDKCEQNRGLFAAIKEAFSL
jgi:uncharacterized protein involved in exopolysaccharide biosynthesis